MKIWEPPKYASFHARRGDDGTYYSTLNCSTDIFSGMWEHEQGESVVRGLNRTLNDFNSPHRNCEKKENYEIMGNTSLDAFFHFIFSHNWIIIISCQFFFGCILAHLVAFWKSLTNTTLYTCMKINEMKEKVHDMTPLRFWGRKKVVTEQQNWKLKSFLM